MFWFLACLLLLAAAAFVLWPWLRRAAGERAPDPDRTAMLSALYRDRLAELEAEAAAGQVQPEERTRLVDELGANLLDELHGRDDRPAPPSARGGGRGASLALAWFGAALVPLLAVIVYLTAGEPGADRVVGAMQVLRLDPREQRAEIESWQDRLAERVARRPDDAQSWYLLGVTRLQLGAYDQAAAALSQARDLAGSDPTLDIYWLQARYLAGNGALDDESRQVAQDILERQPNQPLVLEMYAIDAFHRRDYRQAVTFLNRALNGPLPASQQVALLAGLERARAEMTPLTPTIEVTVTAPPDAPRDATLFVLARPPGGGMPLAVARRPAALLPLSVPLDDTASMTAAARLSDAAQFEVVVRLSTSGSPSAAPGDWEWQSAVLDAPTGSDPLRLEAALAPR